MYISILYKPSISTKINGMRGICIDRRVSKYVLEIKASSSFISNFHLNDMKDTFRHKMQFLWDIINISYTIRQGKICKSYLLHNQGISQSSGRTKDTGYSMFMLDKV